MSSADERGAFAFLKRVSAKNGFAFALIGVIAGVMLLVIPASKTESETPETALTAEEYCALMEEKAQTLIMGLSGVGKCRVVITLSEGYGYFYASDQVVSEESSGDKYVKKTEKKIVLSETGSGKTPTKISETLPKVAGVAVVCPGADYATKYRIIELMCALFDIKSNRISVQS